MKYGYGVDVGGTTVKIAFFNENGYLISKWEIPTNTKDGGAAILPDIAASIAQHLRSSGTDRRDIIGIGIGVPGPVNHVGIVNKCINLGWGVFNISEVLSQLTGFPVTAGNDANVAALGEAWKGSGNGCDNMVMATFGTGVGGGIVLGGRIVHGVHGAGGEIGHLPIRPEEPERCNCGKHGCVEQYCSATGIVRIAKQHLASSSDPSFLRQVEELTCKDVFDCAKQGDSLANEILEEVYDYIGRFLASVCCVVDPETVVLGGGVSKAGQPLLDGAERYFHKHAFHACSDTRFALASLGNDAGAYGAFKMALDAFGG